VHALQVADLGLQVGAPVFRERAGRVAAVRTPAVEVQQVLNFPKGEAEFLSAFDEPQQFDRPRRIVTVATGCSGWVSRPRRS
jgi:hypothetical protein